MSELVERLVSKPHSVSLSRYKTAQGLQDAIDKEFVLIKFLGIMGDTELGVVLEGNDSEMEKLDVRELIGRTNLDFVDVLCKVEVNINTLEGTGKLEYLQ